MRKILSNDHGVALILVILMVSVIVAVTLQLNYSSRSEIYEGVNMRDAIKITYVAKSGFYGGQALLNEDKNGFDTLNEDWAEAELMSAASGTYFDEGYFRLNIVDEAGRIQVNKLVNGNAYNHGIEDLLLGFLTLPEFDLDEQEAADIVDAIKDWIDEDDEVTGFGAENIYYRSLETPYSCKNGPMDCIDELLMVKGITEDLFYGTDEKPGISKYLTVYGEGKININTAPILVLKALSDEITDEMASDMDEFRRNEENDLAGISWYKDVTGMANINIDKELISVKSSIFKIESTGYLNGMEKRLVGFIERSKENFTSILLSWEVE
jgi:general secretion pathway protein K